MGKKDLIFGEDVRGSAPINVEKLSPSEATLVKDIIETMRKRGREALEGKAAQEDGK